MRMSSLRRSTSRQNLEWHRAILTDNQGDLVDALSKSLNAAFTSYLVQHDIITNQEEMDLQAIPIPTEKSWKFVNILQAKGPAEFFAFLHVLRMQGMDYLANKLCSKIDSLVTRERARSEPQITQDEVVDTSQGLLRQNSTLLKEFEHLQKKQDITQERLDTNRMVLQEVRKQRDSAEEISKMLKQQIRDLKEESQSDKDEIQDLKKDIRISKKNVQSLETKNQEQLNKIEDNQKQLEEKAKNIRDYKAQIEKHIKKLQDQKEIKEQQSGEIKRLQKDIVDLHKELDSRWKDDRVQEMIQQHNAETKVLKQQLDKLQPELDRLQPELARLKDESKIILDKVRKITKTITLPFEQQDTVLQLLEQLIEFCVDSVSTPTAKPSKHSVRLAINLQMQRRGREYTWMQKQRAMEQKHKAELDEQRDEWQKRLHQSSNKIIRLEADIKKLNQQISDLGKERDDLKRSMEDTRDAIDNKLSGKAPPGSARFVTSSMEPTDDTSDPMMINDGYHPHPHQQYYKPSGSLSARPPRIDNTHQALQNPTTPKRPTYRHANRAPQNPVGKMARSYTYDTTITHLKGFPAKGNKPNNPALPDLKVNNFGFNKM